MSNVPRKVTKQAPIVRNGKEYWVEYIDDKDGFEHRIVCADGRVTGWAAYTQATHMDDLVGATGYYGGANPDIAVPLMSAKEFCEFTCVGVQ